MGIVLINLLIQAYLHYPFHVALILILQACNSLMIYANVSHAMNSFGNGDRQTQFSIFESLYPNTTNITVGDTFISWNYTDSAANLQYLTEQQGSVLVFDVLRRIFQSYDLQVPAEFADLLTALADDQVPADQATYLTLLGMLAQRFYVSAVYYLVACVSPLPLPVTAGLNVNFQRVYSTRPALAKGSTGLDKYLHASVSGLRLRVVNRHLGRGQRGKVS
jgi:hypothetical protein